MAPVVPVLGYIEGEYTLSSPQSLDEIVDLLHQVAIELCDFIQLPDIIA